MGTQLQEHVESLSRAYRLADGEQARVLREGARISLRQLAAALGTNPGELSRWERGIAKPRTAMALRWLQAIDVLRTDPPGSGQ